MTSSHENDSIPGKLVAGLGSICALIILLIALIVPTLELIFGAIYQNQCTINNNIPIFLIVSGACGIATILLLIIIVVIALCCFKSGSTSKSFAAGCLLGIIVFFIVIMSFFLFAWFIVGNVWIFSAKKNVVYDDITSSNYCHRTLYEFAFWILIVSYIMSVFSCCASCVASCCKAAK